MDTPQTMTLEQAAALGLEHHRAGRLAEALAVYDAILGVRPDHANTLYVKAQVQMQAGDLAAATATLELAARHHPGVAALYALLAECRLALGLTDSALESCRAALERDGRDLRARRVAAAALERVGRLADAAAMLELALENVPTLFTERLTLAGLRRRLGDVTGAAAAFRALTAVAPDRGDAWGHRGMFAIETGDFEEASACLGRGLCLNPGFIELALQAGDLSRSLCDYDGVDVAVARMADLLRSGSSGAAGVPWRHLSSALYRDLFMPLPPDLILSARGEIDRQLTAEASVTAEPQAIGEASSVGLTVPAVVTDGRIHLAFLSANLGNHPIGQVTRSFFGSLDRRRFHLSCFAGRDHTGDPSPYGRDIAGAFDRVHQIGRMVPNAAARLIRDAGVDVLVYLDGYMDKGGMEIVARRPAPTQVYWLGHAGGLGLSAVDYLIADRMVVPPGEEGLYREAVVRLPDIYHCADRHPIAAVAPSRLESGLPEHGVVFCGFNSPEKIDRQIFATWMRILAATPGSVLWLSNSGGIAAARAAGMRANAAAAGIDPDRVVFALRVADKATHLARHGRADLFLDTLTLNASTTALDSLWAGLPILTVRGERFPGRIATAMVTAVGMSDMVCDNLAEYETRAVALAADSRALAELKARLVGALPTAPLFDIGRFADRFGWAVTRMVALRAAGGPPEGFDVPREDDCS